MEMEIVETNEYSADEEELIDQIELEMRKIYLTVEKLYNNICFSESENPIEKSLIQNYVYSLKLLEGYSNEVNRGGNEIQKLDESVQQELALLKSDVQNTLIRINEKSELFNSLDNNIVNLKSAVEAYEQERSIDKEVNNVMKNIKIRFRKEKAELQTIVSCLSSDNSDIQDLIAKITEHHFTEGSDKYLQLEESDNILEHIEFLRRTELFEINPRDPLQIRLADLV